MTAMNLRRTMAGLLSAALVSFIALFPVNRADATAGENPVKIGVLAFRGHEYAVSMWTSTAEYLSAQLPQYSFLIVPLRFEEINPAVEKGEVDFILANSSIYVELEYYYGVNRIATMKNFTSEGGYTTVFGGVIFTRSDRMDIQELSDLRGKSFMAVDETSFGGWRVAWRQLKENGIDPYKEFASLKFGGTHDDVVYAVRDGAVDAGTVRTDILERMSHDGKIEMRTFRILNQKIHEGFPYVISTRLYPEWPFAKVRHTPDELAQKVAVALMNMPEESPAVRNAKIAGWTIPLDYGPVHESLRVLRVGPYKDYGKITLLDAVRFYWYWLALGIVLIVGTFGVAVYVIRLNKGLRRVTSELEESQRGLELKVSERTAELRTMYEELEKEIAERRRAEAVVRERDERLRLLLGSVFEAIYGMDIDGNCTFCNAACLNLLGYEREEDLLGKNMHQLIHHSHADGRKYPWEKCRINRMFREKQGIHVDDEVLWRSDGSCFSAEYWAYPIIKNNLVIGCVVTFIDITDRRKMEEEMTKTQKLESLGVLAGGIAHDFNNILTAIVGNISMVMMQVNPVDELYAKLKEIENASVRAKDLTRQLITFSKGGAPVRKAASLVNVIKEPAVFALRGSNVRCEFSMSENLWSAEIDEGQISQVIHNLVLNAKQAMPSGGIIQINAENVSLDPENAMAIEGGNYVKITVADQGGGIPKEHLKKIFDPYFTTKEKGSGLGLAATYAIIRNHEGYVTAESSGRGGGATFTLYLPASEKQVSGEKAAEDVMSAGSGRVLVMDDEEMVRYVAGEMLRKLGYAVEYARNGEETLEMYKSASESGQPFDIVIMDLTIPGGLGGRETIQRLLETDPGARALVSSGYSDDPVMADYRKFGFAGVLIKPYKINQLSEEVRKVMSSRP